ncbi:MAG: hypothetical protein SchgKO_21470 [Schleiferiaceae bacterium]
MVTFLVFFFSTSDYLHKNFGFEVSDSIPWVLSTLLSIYWLGPIYRSHQIQNGKLTLTYALLFGSMKRELEIDLKNLVDIQKKDNSRHPNAINFIYTPYRREGHDDKFEEEFELDFLSLVERNDLLIELKVERKKVEGLTLSK